MEEALSTLETVSIEAFVKKENFFYETSCGRITHSNDYVPPMKCNALYLDKNDMTLINSEIIDFTENKNILYEIIDFIEQKDFQDLLKKNF